MAKSVSIAPAYSLVLVADRAGRVVLPKTLAVSSVAATSSCIAIACLAEMDGTTEILLGAAGEVDPGFAPVFDGQLETPSRGIAVRSAVGDVVLETDVPDRRTRIRVWTNHPTGPDRVVVGTV